MTFITIPDEINTALQNGGALVISVSGGKDSDAMTYALSKLRQLNNWNGDFILIHADVGRMEHRASLPHCKTLAGKVGAEFVVVRRGDLIDGIRQRMEKLRDDNGIVTAPPFPSSASRYCTSDYKRNPIDKWIRNRYTDNHTVVCTMGLRAQESSARAKKPSMRLRPNTNAPTKNRVVFDWLPIKDWSLSDVWSEIGYTLEELKAIQDAVKSGQLVPANFGAHIAYAFGNERVSCAMCVLGCKSDILNGIEAEPNTYIELVDIELQSGYSFRQDLKLSDLRPDLLRPDQRQQLMTENISTPIQLALF